MSQTEMSFKAFFDGALVRDLASRIECIAPGYFRSGFIDRVGSLEKKEMKERVKCISAALADTLPGAFPEQTEILLSAMSSIPGTGYSEIRGFPVWVATDFIETKGVEHFDESMSALYLLTQRFTAEFAIRPFIVKHRSRAMQLLGEWRTDASPDVRRLVSEGTRPRLPWGMRLQEFIDDPTAVLSLIEPLAHDASEYVRRSIANNLNDIAKDNPRQAVEFCERVRSAIGGEPAQTEWLIRHACRTLIKNGDVGALKLLGYAENPGVSVEGFKVSPNEVEFGDSVEISAKLLGPNKATDKLVIDYAVHFQKKSGMSRKVFKWTNKSIAAGETLRINKSHKLVPVSTRTYYPGRHVVELLINGRSMASADFMLSI